ncbi:17950_t:CDS:2 [Gigaspora margarita]|uniref:17950_t:CDS:1 n=1 Tax=Gigaspora margarita TaxID=4874 RepID=A0ABN7WQH7_GIGMA|nr:17950_t:CDS:2 [Gigaspora margarita]
MTICYAYDFLKSMLVQFLPIFFCMINLLNKSIFCNKTISNDQLTINNLRELNSRLASEITELTKENTEVPELKKKFAKVEAKNTKIKTENAEISEFKKKFAEIEAKNIKAQRCNKTKH